MDEDSRLAGPAGGRKNVEAFWEGGGVVVACAQGGFASGPSFLPSQLRVNKMTALGKNELIARSD